jgi:hypothetical protein
VPQQQPGFSLTNIYYHDDVTAGADVARAREISIGRLPSTLSVGLSGNLHAYVDLNLFLANYAFATPVLGGQLMVSMLGYTAARRRPSMRTCRARF